MHKVFAPRGSSPIFQGVSNFRFVKFVNQPDLCPSPRSISAPCSWSYPTADYYGTDDFPQSSLRCNAPIAGSQTFPNLYPIVKPLGRYLTPGESNRTLNHSYRAIPRRYFASRGACGKTSHTRFLQFSPFRVPSTLTMLHSFHLRVAIGFRSPHHYCPCQSFNRFRFSGYDFTTLCTPFICR